MRKLMTKKNLLKETKHRCTNVWRMCYIGHPPGSSGLRPWWEHQQSKPGNWLTAEANVYTCEKFGMLDIRHGAAALMRKSITKTSKSASEVLVYGLRLRCASKLREILYRRNGWAKAYTYKMQYALRSRFVVQNRTLTPCQFVRALNQELYSAVSPSDCVWSSTQLYLQ